MGLGGGAGHLHLLSGVLHKAGFGWTLSVTSFALHYGNVEFLSSFVSLSCPTEDTSASG